MRISLRIMISKLNIFLKENNDNNENNDSDDHNNMHNTIIIIALFRNIQTFSCAGGVLQSPRCTWAAVLHNLIVIWSGLMRCWIICEFASSVVALRCSCRPTTIHAYYAYNCYDHILYCAFDYDLVMPITMLINVGKTITRTT